MAPDQRHIPDVRTVPVFIYGLTDPDGTIRYVGKSRKPFARFKTHVRRSDGFCVRRWVGSLRAAGKSPRLVILDKVTPGDDAALAELQFIRAFDRDTLLNVHGRRPARVCRFCGSKKHMANIGVERCAKANESNGGA